MLSLHSPSFPPLYLGCWEQPCSEAETQIAKQPSKTVVPILAAPTVFWTLATRNGSWLRWLSRKHWFEKTNGLRSHITCFLNIFFMFYLYKFYVNADILPWHCHGQHWNSTKALMVGWSFLFMGPVRLDVEGDVLCNPCESTRFGYTRIIQPELFKQQCPPNGFVSK